MRGRMLILVLSMLPKHALSRAAGWLATRTVPGRWRGPVYRTYSRVFGARPEEAALPLEQYPTVNAFFTRTLRPGLRPLAADAIVSPVDATVGAYGIVKDDTLVQAKGRNYSLAALLGDRELADCFEGGTYTTLYLSPKDYHRIHFPVSGNVTAATYIPGELWPVNVAAVANVANLFAVNERIVVEVEGERGGRMAIIAVGATMVGMTRLAFDDLHTNARRREVQHRRYDPPIAVETGGALGHFEFGSTVVLVCAPDAGTIEPLADGATVRMGERLGSPPAAAPTGDLNMPDVRVPTED
ncbi:archaetidylserine decarboxylase [Micromonospora siamensis]|uniref:phosphatidylserine decarboxylase n=1 Tax=Micromonospora siamensis TaxID=299152 RepID=A0A1C5J3T8_9ACTN|nr:archaetidylserine decarboxylase [Micromonospora siamensis]SCG65215.1 phosphatidylserine decarboxylase [Micromonospora siamensis]